jgi:hypothetical protein
MKALFARITLGHIALVLVGVVIGLAVGATVLPDSDATGSSALQGQDAASLRDTFDPAFRKVWVRGCVASGDSEPSVDAQSLSTRRSFSRGSSRLPMRSLTAEGS